MPIQNGRAPLDVAAEPLKVQMETFLDEHRAASHACLDGLTEEQARRSLVASRTTLLGLLKHAIYAEKMWFGEAITGHSRQQLGLPPSADDSSSPAAVMNGTLIRSTGWPPTDRSISTSTAASA